ncbi:MAG: arylesterase [Pyrinomonadaceae bacterium]
MLQLIRTLFIFGFTISAFWLTGCGVSTAEKKEPEKPRRSKTVTQTAPDNRPKIIAFGDSLTAGFGLTEKESYPFLLQQKLDADGYSYEVINAGVSGETSLGGLERIDWVLEQKNAEILILELGANDLLRGLPVDKMKENLSGIIKKADEKHVKVLLCGMLAPDTMGAKYQRDYLMAFPDLASEHKVAFLPFILEGIALDKNLNQADGIHPNAEGEKIMTRNVYQALKPLLKK